MSEEKPWISFPAAESIGSNISRIKMIRSNDYMRSSIGISSRTIFTFNISK